MAGLPSQDVEYDYRLGDPMCTSTDSDRQAYMLRMALEIVAITLCSWICVWLISRNEHGGGEQNEALRLLEGSLRRAAVEEADLRSRVETWQEKAGVAELDNIRLTKLADGYELRAKTAEDCLADMQDARMELMDEVALKTSEIAEAQKKQEILEAFSKEQAERIAEITIQLTAAQVESGQSQDKVEQLQAERVIISTKLGKITSGKKIPQVVEVRSLLAAAEQDIAHQRQKVSDLEKDQKSVLEKADSLMGHAKQQSDTFNQLLDRLQAAERQIEMYRAKIHILERSAAFHGRGFESTSSMDPISAHAQATKGVSAEASKLSDIPKELDPAQLPSLDTRQADHAPPESAGEALVELDQSSEPDYPTRAETLPPSQQRETSDDGQHPQA